MNFPRPTLNRSESMRLWMEERSDYAKEQLVLNNIGMVGVALKSLKMNLLDDDLFATGLLGLVKAVNAFDYHAGFAFSSYAVKAIRNEILDSPIVKEHFFMLYTGDVRDDSDFESDIVSKITILESIRCLSKMEKKILRLAMEGKRQMEIAKQIGLSQSMVSRIYKNIRKKLEV